MNRMHHLIRLTSVMTCVHNMRDSLPETVESVLAQRDANYEFLILDDGSTDGTWEYLSTIASNPLVRLFRFETQQGLSAARNFLLQRCRGQAVCIADADDYLAPGKVATHASILSLYPRVGMVWGRSLIQDMSRTEASWELLPDFNYKRGWDLTLDYQATHSATTWRTQLLRELGGYDPRYVLAEAVDMFLKIGDTHEQYFCESIATLKNRDRSNPFRTELAAKGRRVSRELLRNTLKRRFNYSDT